MQHEFILGPLLFLLYKNDTPQALLNSNTYFYVDNTKIFNQDKNVREINNTLNMKLKSL